MIVEKIVWNGSNDLDLVITSVGFVVDTESNEITLSQTYYEKLVEIVPLGLISIPKDSIISRTVLIEI